MDKKELLQRRLIEIGKSLENTGNALALLGLGSAGIEIDRMDIYSDLDFFVIAKNGKKNYFLDNLQWLSQISPVAFFYKNTIDGYKLLYQDQVFCEFAVFEIYELLNIPFAEGKIIWKEEKFDESICKPRNITNEKKAKSKEWLLGEILTNLYIGLCRDKRGEKLSAARFIQQYAVDRIIDLLEQDEIALPAYKDIFSSERRIEERYPTISKELSKFIQGYNNNPQSAKAIIIYLDKKYPIASHIKEILLNLCDC